MKPKKYSSQAIILAKRDYSEADRILVVFSRDYGKIHAIAKGIRKPISKKRGSLEVFSHTIISAVTTKGIDLITETQLIETFPILRSDLKKLTVAYYLMETIGRITQLEEKNEELFRFILKSLKDLEQSKSLLMLREEFIKDILVILGYWPKGKTMNDPDKVLAEVVERQMVTSRVGKRVLE